MKFVGGDITPSRGCGLEGLALAQLADVLHQGMDGVLVQSVPPGRHAGSPSYRKSAELDGLKQLFIGPGFQIVTFGVVARWNREKLGIDAVSLTFNAMTLGTVPLISLPGIFCDLRRLGLLRLRLDSLDLLLRGRLEGCLFVVILSAGNHAEQNGCYCGE